MKMQDFIKKNRKEIDAVIDATLRADSPMRRNDNERRLWVLNDENLYRLAKWFGVKV